MKSKSKYKTWLSTVYIGEVNQNNEALLVFFNVDMSLKCTVKYWGGFSNWQSLDDAIVPLKWYPQTLPRGWRGMCLKTTPVYSKTSVVRSWWYWRMEFWMEARWVHLFGLFYRRLHMYFIFQGNMCANECNRSWYMFFRPICEANCRKRFRSRF